MVWQQVYDPTGIVALSTLLAAVPAVMLVALGFLRIKAHLAAGMGLVSGVAMTATRWVNYQGTILRFAFLRSIALACLVGGVGDAARPCLAIHADGREMNAAAMTAILEIAPGAAKEVACA